jgi:hypothetical protein
MYLAGICHPPMTPHPQLACTIKVGLMNLRRQKLLLQKEIKSYPSVVLPMF